jgi:hypothetical protein
MVSHAQRLIETVHDHLISYKKKQWRPPIKNKKRGSESFFFYKKKQWRPPSKKREEVHYNPSFADGSKVHLRTCLKLCTSGKRQAGRETLAIRHLHVALIPHATPKVIIRPGQIKTSV